MQKLLSTIIISFSLLIIVLACKKDPDNNQSDAGADLVLHNAQIYTVNKAQPWAEAIAIKDGAIIYVGSDEGVEDFIGDQTEVEDLGGKMVMPGIHDVHQHPLEAMSPLGICHLGSDETDPENFIPTIHTCKHDRPAGVDFVFGFGHSISTLYDAERPPVEILDEAVDDRPAIIMEETSHSMWVNSKALEMAGIDANSPNPQGGIILKDEITGEPDGILYDAAGDFMLDMFWKPTEAIKELNYEGLLEAMPILSENGITSVCEARTYWRRAFQEAWTKAEDENELTVRAVLCLWGYPHLDDEEQILELKALYQNDPNKLVRMNQIKLYSDGIIPNTTAALHEAYDMDLGILPENKGLNYFTEDRMRAYITELEQVGFDIHIHAIGDRGIHEALNAIEAARHNNGIMGTRHRLTHLEVVDPADYPRFKDLGVIADCQVAGAFTQPENWEENEPFIGNRTNNFVPLKDLHQAGAMIALSSDWDVSTVNPFVGMQNALTRAPQNLPDLETVIRAYTINGAFVMRQETLVGSLEVGKLADLIVLDRNLFEIPISEIKQTKVLKTYLEGELVFEH